MRPLPSQAVGDLGIYLHSIAGIREVQIKVETRQISKNLPGWVTRDFSCITLPVITILIHFNILLNRIRCVLLP